VDERNNMQILLYGSLATGDDDILPGHSWVEREALEVQNMKYYCPTMLQASLQEQQKLIESYHGLDDGMLKAPEEIARLRKDRDAIKDKLDQATELPYCLLLTTHYVVVLLTACCSLPPAHLLTTHSNDTRPGHRAAVTPQVGQPGHHVVRRQDALLW
jgi:hypothetical protein